MISIVHLKTDEDFTSLAQAWNPLLRQSPVDDAFLTWEWIHTWWKYYGHSYQLLLLVVREDEQLVGIAPLMLEVQKFLGIKLRVLRNIGIPPPDVGGLIIQDGREDVLNTITQWLIDHHTMWDVLLIGEIPSGSMNFNTWIAQFPKHIYQAQVTTTRHFYIPMDKGWHKYYHGLSKNLRKNLNKSIRHLQEETGYQFQHKRGRDATLQDMEKVFQINQKARHPYLYREQTDQAFHNELASSMADQGWLDLYFLYAGDVPSAFRYGFWYNQKYEAWRSGFDSAYYPFSVGRVILFFLIQEGFDHGMKALDFLSGAEDFKLNWQVETQFFYHLCIVRRKPFPLIVHFYYPQFKKSVKEFLEQHESLHPILKWIERLANAEQNRRGIHSN